MTSNIDRFKKDLATLVAKGRELELAIQAQALPREFEDALKERFVKAGGKAKKTTADAKKVIAALPPFLDHYQKWYSEAQALVKQLLPDRLADFVRYYEKPKSRKEITYENYRIEDYLQSLHVTRGWEKTEVVGPQAAIPQFRQQLSILEAASARFESSLFDIRQLVRADLFDSELDAARELLAKRFTRAAGAVAGVVLEKHLAQVCENRSISIRKKTPTIGDLNSALKDAGVIDIPPWRFVQHLADLRNLCDHEKKVEPTPEQVADLIAGADKVIKTVF